MAQRERRRGSRYRTIRTQVHFGWWEGTTFHRRRGTILNLSQDGALLVCCFLPPAEGTEAWVTLACHAPEPWHGARVVGSSVFAEGRWQVRLAFRTPFPEEQFARALTGTMPAPRPGGRLEPPPRTTCLDETGTA